MSLVALGCAAREPLPTVTAEEMDPPPAEAPGVASDPIRMDYRALLAECEVHRDELQAELDQAEDRRARQSVGAVVAAAAGEALDVRDDTDVPTDGMGGQPACPGDRDPNRAGPCASPTLNADPSRSSPAEADVAQRRADGLQQLRAITAAIDQTDELLFAHPDPATWDEARRNEWLERRNSLARLCGYDEPPP